MTEEEGHHMGFRGATSRRRAISVHTAIVSLVALAAVFVTLVLMHGMNDTRTMVAHAGVVPAETAFSTDAAQTPGDELDEPLTGVYATSLVVSSAQDDLAPTDPMLMDQAEGGAGPFLGFAVFILFVLVSLGLGLRLLPFRRGIFTHPCPRVLVRGGPGIWVRTFPIRLVLSIDRR